MPRKQGTSLARGLGDSGGVFHTRFTATQRVGRDAAAGRLAQGALCGPQPWTSAGRTTLPFRRDRKIPPSLKRTRQQ